MIDNTLNILRCPGCFSSEINETENNIICNGCKTEYEKLNKIPVLLNNDLRKKVYVKNLITVDNSKHWKKEAPWKSEFIKSIPKGSGICLDLGCGGGQKSFIESLGYRYVGLDYSIDRGVDVLCSITNIPIKDSSVDLCVSNAVMEHIYDPWAASNEIYRVLKPGGCYIGTTAFIQPFHENSYYHMTHLGLKQMLNRSGFEIVKIEPLDISGIESILGTLTEINRPLSIIFTWLFHLIMRIRLCGILIFGLLYKNNPAKLQRVSEFKEEEKFRFASGFLYIAEKK